MTDSVEDELFNRPWLIDIELNLFRIKLNY